MKVLLQILLVVLCAWFIIWLDTLLYDFVVSLIPNGEWKRLIKVIIIIVMIMYTSGLVLFFIAIASAFALMILDVFMPTLANII